MRVLSMGLIWLVTSAAGLSAEPSAGTADADYERDIRPLLRSRCLTCHGGVRQRGGLRVDTVAALLQGGDSGPAIEPKRAADSELIARVSSSEDGYRMPPEGDPLSATEIQRLVHWINAGAPRPEIETPDPTPGDHWAFRRPERPAVPSAPQSRPERSVWSDSPVDAFVARRQADAGLVPQPQADRQILLRRVYLDLIGLPPSPAQRDAFLADDSADAWRKVVDELLESPHYGERWGRHWMDVWRYSDWYGYRAELRNSARHMWRWRDWIIESLNKDRPYDRMIVEMLAGDELAPDDPETVRATGFLARHYFKFNRNTWLDATIEHTGKAFLGLTLNCARCHDHMYDPVSQREYYRYRAIFEPYNVRTDRVPGEADTTRDGLSLAFDQKLDAVTYLFRRGNDKHPVEDDPLQPGIPAMFADDSFDPQPVELPVAAWYPGFREYIQEETRQAARQAIEKQQQALEAARKQLQAAQQQVALLTPVNSGTDADSPSPSPEPEADSQPDAETGNSIVLSDRFERKRDDLWRYGPGDWQFEDGHLVQRLVGATRRLLTSRKTLPRDFSATFTVRILNGERWKSVGLDFDVLENDSAQTVYLSAHAGGPKIQYSYRVAGQVTYPPTAQRALPITVGKLHTLRVDVADSLLNAYVDGELQLKIQLPVKRQTGSFTLWAFDAAAEFHAVEVQELPAGTSLRKPNDSGTSPAAPVTLADAEAAVNVAEAKLAAVQKSLAAAEAQLESVVARIAADNARYGRDPAANQEQRARKAARMEFSARLMAAHAEQAEARAELLAAERLAEAAAKKKAVDAASGKLAAAEKKVRELSKNPPAESSTAYSPLGPVYPATSTGRRLALARWIASKKNPLTARVAVNHIWMRHFGEPLVPTVFDFGMNGKPPTHPELLDWLACEFMDSGWSMKHLHRLMVLSRTYRLASSDRGADERTRARDPDNRMLWRAHVRRLESEVVRDSVLAVAGTLDRSFGGPELDQTTGLTTTRRSVYYRHAPEKFMTFLEQFDSASPDECYRRNETIVPQQALTLMNSQLAIEQARHLAAVLADGPQPYVEALFVRVLSRTPTPAERQTCEAFLERQARQFTATAELEPFDDGPKLNVAPSSNPEQRARENLAHVLLNHNDFVTVR